MDLKRDQKRRPNRVKRLLARCIKKMLFLAIFICLIGGIGWAAYRYNDPVRKTFDQVGGFVNPIVQEYGWLPVIAGALLVLGAIWAIVDEQSEKENLRRNQGERN